MRLVYDGLLRWAAPTGPVSVSHLRVYADEKPTEATVTGALGRRVVAVVGELSDNPGMSVTNGWEHLGPQALAAIERLVPGARVTFVEHYPPDVDRAGWGAVVGTFDEVALGEGGSPTWSASSQGFVENVMVGQRVEVWPIAKYVSTRFSNP